MAVTLSSMNSKTTITSRSIVVMTLKETLMRLMAFKASPYRQMKSFYESQASTVATDTEAKMMSSTLWRLESIQ